MSRAARRGRARVWVRPSILRRVLRFVWRILRTFLLLGVALAPGMPPPPPPPPHPTEQQASEGEVMDEQ